MGINRNWENLSNLKSVYFNTDVPKDPDLEFATYKVILCAFAELVNLTQEEFFSCRNID